MVGRSRSECSEILKNEARKLRAFGARGTFLELEKAGVDLPFLQPSARFEQMERFAEAVIERKQNFCQSRTVAGSL